jgi:malonate decarboxylase epsilon subunit
VNVAFLFPGQGSQLPGLLQSLPHHRVIQKTLDEVSKSLSFDLSMLDSAVALESTVSVQLVLLVSGVAVARALIADGIEPTAVAGMSTGAFAAAVTAGVLSLSDAVRLVEQRAREMVILYPKGYGLAAIVGLTEKQVQSLVERAFMPQHPVYVANVNAPRQIVIAGYKEALMKVLEAARQSGAHKTELLNISVPSHCILLEPVANALKKSLSTVRLQRPRFIYVGNVNARALRTSQAIAEDLANNIAHRVRWYDATTILKELGCRVFLEMPPGHVLSDLAKDAFASQGVETVALADTSLRHAEKVATRY